MNMVYSFIDRLNNLSLFLKSPETFRAFFGCRGLFLKSPETYFDLQFLSYLRNADQVLSHQNSQYSWLFLY